MCDRCHVRSQDFLLYKEVRSNFEDLFESPAKQAGLRLLAYV